MENIVHIDIQKSNIISICDECFSNLATEGDITYLNLAHNNIRTFSETLQTVHSLEEVYLAGNPINCNCDMIWFAEWINATTPSGVRIVKDYQDIKCSGGEWDDVLVYQVDGTKMGCLPFPG